MLAFFMKSACDQVRAHGRHAVDDGTDRSAMRFTIGVNAVEVTESGHDCEAYVYGVGTLRCEDDRGIVEPFSLTFALSLSRVNPTPSRDFGRSTLPQVT
jgi:hypothetical protein